MEVIETNIKNFNDELPPYKKPKYPQPLDNNLPANYNVSIFVGSRGSGKTTIAVKILYEIEKIGLENNIQPRIILISPTAKSDSNKVFNVLKSLDENDIIENYTEEALKNKIEELRNDLLQIEEYNLYKKSFEKFIKNKRLYYDDFLLLEKYNYEDPINFDIKYPNGFIVYLIVDDMAGTSIFKNGKSYFSNIVIKNRHKSEYNIPMNIFICVQQLFNIPKTIRLQANFICLFKYGNAKVITEDLYDLVSAWTTPEEFLLLYNTATENPHSCLIIDITRGKPIFKKGLSTLLEIKK